MIFRIRWTSSTLPTVERLFFYLDGALSSKTRLMRIVVMVPHMRLISG